MIAIKKELPGNARVEMIMKVMATYNRCPGAHWASYDLSKLPTPTIVRYHNIATQIDTALSAEEMKARG